MLGSPKTRRGSMDQADERERARCASEKPDEALRPERPRRRRSPIASVITTIDRCRRTPPNGMAGSKRQDVRGWRTSSWWLVEGPSSVSTSRLKQRSASSGSLGARRPPVVPRRTYPRRWSRAQHGYFRCFARPLVLRAAPRPRAALPLAPAERLPVSLAKASMILPAILSTVPSALSRDADFIASRPF